MRRVLASIVALASVSSGVARAQEPTAATAETVRSERPFRGLFGAARPADRGSVLNVHFTLDAAYDDNVLGDQGVQVPDPRVNTSGYYSLANVDAEYQHIGRRITVGLDGGSSARYYTDFTDLTAVATRAGAHMTGLFGDTRIILRQSVDDTPFYGFRFLPQVGSEVASPGSPQPVQSLHAHVFNTTAAVTQTLSRRSEVNAAYDLRHTQFVGDGSDFTVHGARAAFRYQLTSYAAFRAGYGSDRGTYSMAAGGPARLDTIDLGVDYRRPLSFSRRTTIDFNAGSTSASQAAGPRVYLIVGDAGLTHEIGRTWSLRAAVRRNAALFDGLAAPVASSGATVSLGGFLHRRFELRSEAGYASGTVGLTGVRNPFDTIDGRVRAQFALTPQFAVSTEYSYYQYHFRSTDLLPAGVSSDLRRTGVRVGLELFLPVFTSQGK